MKLDLSRWPEIDPAGIAASFREVPMEDYPELESYGRRAVHDGLSGQGGLFLASDMAKLLTLRPGMRVLDLGCGSGATAVFLARTFGVHVCAVDVDVRPDLTRRVSDSDVKERITIVGSDARTLPFPSNAFDAVFSMNAFFYFGTDDLYPSYLLGFLKQGGEVVIGGPCYRAEISDSTPEEFLLEFPACLAVHSAEWWRNHFEKTLRQYVAETYGCWDDAVQRRMFDEKFDPSRIRIIEVDAQDVGMIELHEHEDHLLLALIEILPARQRQEIGSSVIRQVLARANEENRPVELQVLRPNPARALYERLGFTVFAETPTHYRMRKRPNKSPEPTPTAVTPRATELESK